MNIFDKNKIITIYKNNLLLFITGMIQIFFVSSNITFISKNNYYAAYITAFFISYIWSINVQKINKSTKGGIIFYCTGCATGNIIGMYLANNILHFM